MGAQPCRLTARGLFCPVHAAAANRLGGPDARVEPGEQRSRDRPDQCRGGNPRRPAAGPGLLVLHHRRALPGPDRLGHDHRGGGAYRLRSAAAPAGRARRHRRLDRDHPAAGRDDRAADGPQSRADRQWRRSGPPDVGRRLLHPRAATFARGMADHRPADRPVLASGPGQCRHGPGADSSPAEGVGQLAADLCRRRRLRPLRLSGRDRHRRLPAGALGGCGRGRRTRSRRDWSATVAASWWISPSGPCAASRGESSAPP